MIHSARTDRLSILNIWVDPVTREEAVTRVCEMLQHGDKPHFIFASNPEKNFSVPKDPVLYTAFKNADLLIPDGIGIVLAARILYGLKLTRLPGADFFMDICRLAEKEHYGVFIYGAKEEVNKKAASELQGRYPNLNIAGRSNGYVPQERMPELVDKINNSKAQILFLALGSPMQEKWLATYKNSLRHVRVCQGVGGTLDTIAGTVKRAPIAWQQMNLEWLYRLIEEPKRIQRQKLLPLFAALVLLQKGKSLLGKV